MDNLAHALERFVEYLSGRLQAEGVFADQVPTLRCGDGEGWLGLSDRWLARVTMQGSNVIIAVPDDAGDWQDHPIGSLAELDARLPLIARHARLGAQRLTVYSLRPGGRYRVVRDFDDFHGQHLVAGTELVFEEMHFLPYEDGYTLCFVGTKVYVRGDSLVYARFGFYVVEAT